MLNYQLVFLSPHKNKGFMVALLVGDRDTWSLSMAYSLMGEDHMMMAYIFSKVCNPFRGVMAMEYALHTHGL